MKNEKKDPENLIELLAELKKDGIPQNQYKMWIDRFLEKQAWEKGIPLKGQFELTPFCNLDCRMCYVHLEKGQVKRTELLEVEKWKKLMEEAVAAGMRKAVLTGGECLLYPGFEELYRYLQAKGVEIQVYTNGILLTEERAAFFKKHMPARIQISVYGSCEEGYERVTGQRMYHTVMQHLTYAMQEGLPVQAAVTPNRYMGRDAEKIVWDLAERGIPYQINNTIFMPREETGRKGAVLDIAGKEYLRLFQLQAALSGEKLCKIEKKALPEIPKDAGSQKGIRCAAGRNSFHISWRGQMTGCDVLNDQKEEPLQTGFQEAWKRIHKAAMAYPSAVKCETCAYAGGCICCPAVHRQYGEMPGNCSRRVCERARKFVAEGLAGLR